jgi:micrococcal nuclease
MAIPVGLAQARLNKGLRVGGELERRMVYQAFPLVSFPPPPRRSRAGAASAALSIAALAGLAAFALLPLPAPAPPDPALLGTVRTAAGEVVSVVDGDTVDVAGRRYRLVGHDTPEIFHARCPAERDRGIAAAARLLALLRSGAVTVERIDGREKWGRGLARLTVDGRDVGATLIAEGHARAYDGRTKREPWCP